MSDAPLTECPACGAQAFGKQLTAAGFQLKGSGWYVTDFRGGSGGGASGTPSADKSGEAKPAESKDDSGAAKPADSSKSDTPSAASGGCGGSCACH
ncbi:hypothetical protein GCM10027034_25590 [Ramlibacter solisilvae]